MTKTETQFSWEQLRQAYSQKAPDDPDNQLPALSLRLPNRSKKALAAFSGQTLAQFFAQTETEVLETKGYGMAAHIKLLLAATNLANLAQATDAKNSANAEEKKPPLPPHLLPKPKKGSKGKKNPEPSKGQVYTRGRFSVTVGKRPSNFFSPSRVGVVKSCKRKYFETYINKHRAPTTPSQAKGLKMHKSLEDYLGGKISFDELMPCAKPGIPHLPKPGKPGMRIEESFALSDDQMFRSWYGLIDVWDVADGLVLDHKSTKSFRYAKNAEQLRVDPQILLYGIVSLVVSGDDEVDLRWVYYKTEGTPGVFRSQVTMTWDELLKGYEEHVYPRALEMQIIHDNPSDVPNVPKGDYCEEYGGCWHGMQGFCPQLQPPASLAEAVQRMSGESKKETEAKGADPRLRLPVLQAPAPENSRPEAPGVVEAFKLAYEQFAPDIERSCLPELPLVIRAMASGEKLQPPNPEPLGPLVRAIYAASGETPPQSYYESQLQQILEAEAAWEDTTDLTVVMSATDPSQIPDTLVQGPQTPGHMPHWLPPEAADGVQAFEMSLELKKTTTREEEFEVVLSRTKARQAGATQGR